MKYGMGVGGCKMVKVAFWCKLPYLWMCLMTSITHRKAHIKGTDLVLQWGDAAFSFICSGQLYAQFFWIYHCIKNDGFTKHGRLCKKILFFNYWKVWCWSFTLELITCQRHLAEPDAFIKMRKNSIAPSQHRCLKNLGIRICISSLQGGPDQEAGFIRLQLSFIR